MSEEAAKIEPTLTAVEDAPSIVAAAPEAPAAETPKPVVAEAPKPAITAEPPKPEVAAALEKALTEKAPAEPAAAKEPPAMPRAPQLSAEPHPALNAPIFVARGPKPKAAPAVAAAPAQPRSRFALLAATVAIAASFGAIAGSLGATMFSHQIAAAPVAPATSTASGDEIRALKENVAQLRASTKALSDNVAGLKMSVSSANAQLTKLSEALERSQAEQQRRAAVAPPAAAAPETTGSINKPAPVVLGDPPGTLKHPIVPGWTLRKVYDGVALIEGREGVVEVEPGITIPGIGRIEEIKKYDGRWAVFTSKGIIVSAR